MIPKDRQSADAGPDEHAQARRAIRKLNAAGLAIVVVCVGGIGGWAATSELAGAVIASGTVIVETVDKKVQHPTGGVIKDILVRDGSIVEEGQIIVRLDGTVPRATLGVVQSQADELLARRARLLAERDDAAALSFSGELESRRQEATVSAAMAGETRLFQSRKATRGGLRAQLRERIAQNFEEIRGLAAQQEAKESEVKLIEEELTGVAELYRKNLVSISRFMTLRREQSRLQGERGQLIAEIARARARIGETELQILQLDHDFRTEVLKELREADARIAELTERIVAASDQLQRIDIRAPRSGVVHALAVHTIGGVIGNGETIMSIVPREDSLIVEAKVAPPEVDQIGAGSTAVVRVSAGNQRTMPVLNGVVTHVSANLAHDPATAAGPGPAYYLIRVALPKVEVERLGAFRLLPGMPAQVFVQTEPRTALQYLLKPLLEQVAHTFRER